MQNFGKHMGNRGMTQIRHSIQAQNVELGTFGIELQLLEMDKEYSTQGES